jgi:ABC-type protease/lipase transport system fused ATPase/permease subunit
LTRADLKRTGATIVVIAHRPSVLAMVDKLIVLRDGMIERLALREEVLAEVERVPPRRPVPVEPPRPIEREGPRVVRSDVRSAWRP